MADTKPWSMDSTLVGVVCPSCKALFCGLRPKKPAKGLCIACQKQLVLLPDGTITLFGLFDLAKWQREQGEKKILGDSEVAAPEPEDYETLECVESPEKASPSTPPESAEPELADTGPPEEEESSEAASKRSKRFVVMVGLLGLTVLLGLVGVGAFVVQLIVQRSGNEKPVSQPATKQQGASSADTKPDKPTSSEAFQQDSTGMVCVEAEACDEQVEAGEHQWVKGTLPDASGGAVMEAQPNNGTFVNKGYAKESPRLDYRIDFTQTGMHYVWIRGAAPTSSDDTVHVGLDGAEVGTSDRMSRFTASFSWSHATLDGPVASFTVSSKGVHTLNVWMREDGFQIDKILVTVDAAYVPQGEGPKESARGTVTEEKKP